MLAEKEVLVLVWVSRQRTRGAAENKLANKGYQVRVSWLNKKNGGRLCQQVENERSSTEPAGKQRVPGQG